ncbi:MAG: nitrous oxide reductase family maturation protein NosD [Candidatus Eremiobacterota bacterium]
MRLAALLLAAWLLSPPAGAAPRAVSTESDLVAALRESDHILVRPGHYRVHLVVDRPVVLEGQGWPVLDGGGTGTVVTVNAPDVVVRGFEIRGSGSEPEQDHAGVTLNAPRGRVEGNRFRDVLFGVVVSQADRSLVRGNDIQSKPEFELGRKGDGIRLWYSQGVTVEGNLVEGCRDLVSWYSSDVTFRGNRVRDGRYGIHFMYCDRSLVEDNEIRSNSVGIYTMYSTGVTLRNNRILGCRGASGYALGFKDADEVRADGNLLVDSRVGIFLDSTPITPGSRCEFADNVLAYNDVGVGLFPSVRGAGFTANSFQENAEQVRLEGGGQQTGNAFEGNYWSDYEGFDLDEDGAGDVPYRSQRLFENLADRDPSLRLFLGTPAQQTLDAAARVFPLVSPQPKLEDPRPRLSPPALPAEAAPPWSPLGLAWPALAVLSLGLLRRLRRQSDHLPLLEGRKPAMNTMLKITGVTKRFGALTAVDDLSLEVPEGSAVALWGANGAGKTTLMRCLLGLVNCQGQLEIGGVDARRDGKRARSMLGYVPQELSFHDDLTVAETMDFYATLRQVPRRETRDALKTVGLDHCPERRVGCLSGGMKQRLALALALLGSPPLLLLDEPTSNLDLQGREEFLRLLVELRAGGKTLLFTSHRLDEVLALADRVVVLEKGRVTLTATPAELVGKQGWQAVLKLRTPPDRLEDALELLVRSGYRATRNGCGVWVHVATDRKATPIQTLVRAGIPVTDFEM